jgi:hypothetical protein
MNRGVVSMAHPKNRGERNRLDRKHGWDKRDPKFFPTRLHGIGTCCCHTCGVLRDDAGPAAQDRRDRASWAFDVADTETGEQA